MEKVNDWNTLTKWTLETYWPTKAPSEQVVPALQVLFQQLLQMLKSFKALKNLETWCDGLYQTLLTLDVTSTPLQTILERWPSTDMCATPFIDSTKLVQLETMLSMCVIHAQTSLSLKQQTPVDSGPSASTSTAKDEEVTYTFSTFAPLVTNTQIVGVEALLNGNPSDLLLSDEDTSSLETNGVEDNCCYIYRKVRRECSYAK